MTCCEICATAETATERASRGDAKAAIEEESQAPHGVVAQHSGYTGEKQTLFAELLLNQRGYGQYGDTDIQ